MIAEFTGVPQAPAVEQTRAFFPRTARAPRTGSELTLAIADPVADEFLGTISLLRFE